MPTDEGFQGVSNCYVFKSQLQEYAQKVGIPTPVYETVKEGPSHEPSFKSTVIVNDVRYDSLLGFSNRKFAEQSAAEVALVELAKSADVSQSISQPIHETGLCKNLLQEYAQKMNYAIPLYQCQKEDSPGRAQLYSCTVEIGGIRYVGAAAKTKKEAEIKVARTALLAIQSSKSEASTEPVGNIQLTVLPSRKRRAESNTKSEENPKVPKPKKGRFKNRKFKKKLSGNKVGHSQGQNAGNLEVNMDGNGISGSEANTSVNPMAAEAIANAHDLMSRVIPSENQKSSWEHGLVYQTPRQNAENLEVHVVDNEISGSEANTSVISMAAESTPNTHDRMSCVIPCENQKAAWEDGLIYQPPGQNAGNLEIHKLQMDGNYMSRSEANPSAKPMVSEATQNAHDLMSHVIPSENQKSAWEHGLLYQTQGQNAGNLEVHIGGNEISGSEGNTSVNPMAAEATPNTHDSMSLVIPREYQKSAWEHGLVYQTPGQNAGNLEIHMDGNDMSGSEANPSVKPMAAESTQNAHDLMSHVIASEKKKSAWEDGVVHQVNDVSAETGQSTASFFNHGDNGTPDVGAFPVSNGNITTLAQEVNMVPGAGKPVSLANNSDIHYLEASSVMVSFNQSENESEKMQPGNLVSGAAGAVSLVNNSDVHYLEPSSA